MAELITVARPYAQAIFNRAKESGKLSDWSATLKSRYVENSWIRKEAI